MWYSHLSNVFLIVHLQNVLQALNKLDMIAIIFLLRLEYTSVNIHLQT